MIIQLSKLRYPVTEEYPIGTGGRVFRTSLDEWWWQARDTNDIVGPFRDRDVAEFDYNTSDAE